MATFATEEDGSDVITTNYVRYADEYVRLDGRWRSPCCGTSESRRSSHAACARRGRGSMLRSKVRLAAFNDAVLVTLSLLVIPPQMREG
ncbi:MAG: hypothetical protein Q4A07_11570 [Coriobacteriales bacterium]|nr:hypothetical protein [Coriobacteriales bacterium]